MARNSRPDESYEVQALSKGLRVLRALEDGRPATLKRVQERTGFSANDCTRFLTTLKINGFARKTDDGWTLGAAAIRLSKQAG
jgi:DNA-binding IclR family transcriptional regulator